MSETREVVINNSQGLHARPIALIAELANKHQSSLTISVDDRGVDGRSILQLMTLCAGKGSTLELSAEGEDATGLLDALVNLVESGFGED